MPLLLAFLAACGSQSGPEGREPGPAPAVDPLAGMEGAAAADPALLEQRAREAMLGVVADPQGAQLSVLRPGRGGAICGEVEGQMLDGGPAGPRPFVVTGGGIAVVSPQPRIAFHDPTDPFADLYMQTCATREELVAMGQALEDGVPPGTGDPAAADPLPPVPPLPEPALPPPPDPPPPPSTRWSGGDRAAPAPNRPAPKQGERSSFFDAVVRPGE